MLARSSDHDDGIVRRLMYQMRGGMEAVYDDVKKPLGMMKFAPAASPHGSMLAARRRLGRSGEAPQRPDGAG